ncbi:winged helix-turn-helix transcriptional regulator [Streptomyces sp. H27-D2]|uniref:winged helix-turn-helix transcriptional regulator n=1 Tax=Streptomyces sp. H27-D2 TaxID=3046304 RepID=UPI002DBEBC01|nr:winged helix-turn-helix transcriptional regulator [Streptomyces sp. H27-D2]MEC4016383.1 winged helix-turn-helix transcriptional regulator [Streptomyces sp. H27-D2]
MERDGLVSRTVSPTVPPRVEYRLTALGAEVGRLAGAIADWSVEHAREILAARGEFDDALRGACVPLHTGQVSPDAW